jgi:hypothetical protein
MNRVYLSGFCAAAVVLGLAHSSRSQQASEPIPAASAVPFLRALNTVQAGMAARAGRYGTLADAIAEPAIGPFAARVALKEDGAAFLGGGSDRLARRLEFVLSADATHYQAGVVPAEGCGVAWFTSDRGVIYQARPLGCPGP